MKFLIFLTVLFLSQVGISQYNWNNQTNRLSHHFLVGASVGNEYFISAPKLSYFARYDLIHKYGHSQLEDFEFKRLFIYGGIDASLFVFFMGAFGASTNLGFQAGYFTFENSISACYYTLDSWNSFNTTTYNIKAGIELGPVWLKAGPSFNLRGEPLDFIRVSRRPFNFEILIDLNYNQ